MTLLHPEPAIPTTAPLVGCDVETDATPAQRLVAVAIHDETGGSLYHANGDAWVAHLQLVIDRGAYLVAHNARFDIVAMRDHLQAKGADARWILDAVAAGRILCTQVREELIGIAAPTDMGYVVWNAQIQRRAFNLDGLCQRYLRTPPMVKGADSWRLRFGELLPFPVSAWPEAARRYALDDVEHLASLVRAQKRAARRHPDIGTADLRVSPDEMFQVRASVALESMSRRGMMPDGAHAERLAAELEAEAEGHRTALIAAGLMRHKHKKKRPSPLVKDTKKAQALIADAFEARGLEVPTTATGLPKTDAKTLKTIADWPDLPEALRRWSALTTAEKMVSTYAAPVIEAAKAGHPIQTRYRTLLETGRTSSSGPNIQNLPRRAGMRELYRARPGMALVAADYDTAELRALGQVCLDLFGESRFADFYNDDPAGDPHCALAVALLDDGTSYDDLLAAHRADAMSPEQKLARQGAKGVNFGAPGGLGASAMVDYLAGYGIRVDESEAKRLLGVYRETWNMGPYFRWVERHKGPVYQTFTGRLRGGTTYCSRANTPFQGLIADAAKQALWDVETQRPPDLWLWAFIHDEIIIETPVARVDAAATWLRRTMERAAAYWIPDVPMRAGAHAMFRWAKGARAVRDDAGRLVPDPATGGEA